MKKVLWLASWYPNQLSRFDGDFLQRHAKAVSLFCRVHVIYVVKDECRIVTDKYKAEETTDSNLTEQIIYYTSFKTRIKILDKYFSQKKYNQLYKRAINRYIANIGKPDLVHVQIAMKAGLAALWIKRKWGIPYIVSEQWTGYLSNADHKISDYPFIYRNWIKHVLTEAFIVSVVSDYLGSAIQNHFQTVEYRVIPNVVDTTIFYPAQNKNSAKTRFIHISNMNYQKNTKAILEALYLLKNEEAFEIYLFGTHNQQIKNLIKDYALQDHVFIKGEVAQPELADAIRQSDALILYSRFETFGCVIIEANACGIPVIVSDIEVFHELVEDGVNGMFAETEKPKALAQKLKQFILQKNTFDKMAIANAASQKYNFKNVGQQFLDLYKSIN
jgi:glycosyltransferase involved in cell wall biosynthesis